METFTECIVRYGLAFVVLIIVLKLLSIAKGMLKLAVVVGAVMVIGALFHLY